MEAGHYDFDAFEVEDMVESLGEKPKSSAHMSNKTKSSRALLKVGVGTVIFDRVHTA